VSSPPLLCLHAPLPAPADPHYNRTVISRNSAQHGFARLAPAVAAALLLLAGCSRTPPPPPTSAPADSPRLALREIVRLRQARRYEQLRPCIVAARAHGTIVTLMAVDEFLDANRALCDTVRDKIGPGVAQMIDQSDLSNIVGPFAPEVELLDVTLTGATADVAFSAAHRLPPDHATMQLDADRWLYDPGPGYTDKLPAAFRQLAAGLRSVAADLDSGRLPTRGLFEQPAPLVERVRSALRPGIKTLSEARAAAVPESQP